MFNPDPLWCCEACVFRRGPHTCKKLWVHKGSRAVISEVGGYDSPIGRLITWRDRSFEHYRIGFDLVVDPALPKDTVEFRDRSGRVVGKITGLPETNPPGGQES